MPTAYPYRCADYPGMGDCPGVFTALTRAEVLALTELHARLAHDENPSAWTPEERLVEELIRPVSEPRSPH